VAKLVAMPLLLAAACLIAGVYGALHNQISYTVSPDYFHAFKFQQFQIAPRYHDRLGASIVGFLASWWMGVLVGAPILFVGLKLPDARSYVRHCLIAFGVVAITALVVGFGALAWGMFAITETNLPDFGYPLRVADRVAFARAGVMHNFSYLGGFLGIVTGIAYLLFQRSRLNRGV
jgi:hypothetical protein